MSIESKKLDILLEFSKEYNLKETEDPATYEMDCGKGYTLRASSNKPWIIRFNDGLEITDYPVDSTKVPFTSSKDAINFQKKFNAKVLDLADEIGEEERKDAWGEVKEIEDKKAIEAKAKAEREANLKKLEMAEKEEEFEASITGNNSVSKPVSDNAIFTERPVEYVEAPAPKNGVVNLYDVLNKICKHDLMQVFGNTGTGKTSLCTKLALDARAKGKSVMYIDTEGSINDDQIEAMKKTGTKYEFIKQFQKLCDTVKRLPKVNVLIVDSAGVPALAAYCKANMGGQGEILKKFIAMSDDLKIYATENNALVVVVNQPESSMSKGENAILEPFGEKSRYYYKEILKTNYAKRGRTTAKTTLVLSAHRSRCMGIDTPVCTMEVTNDGVTVIQ